MKKSLKSIGAVLAGFIIITILSIITDTILEQNGILPKGALPMHGADAMILGIILYRSVYSIFGVYVTAKIAPSNPMKHALALGAFAAVITAIGSIITRDLAPAWFGWSLVVLSLPLSWIGGKLALSKRK